MIKLYRAISQGEKDNFDLDRQFRTGERTLEVKQFFKSRKAVMSFVASSILQDYNPPYAFLLTVSINEDLLEESNPESMPLDGFEAISINEIDLESFNDCVIFVDEEDL
jgi:hypothetical protein